MLTLHIRSSHSNALLPTTNKMIVTILRHSVFRKLFIRMSLQARWLANWPWNARSEETRCFQSVNLYIFQRLNRMCVNNVTSWTTYWGELYLYIFIYLFCIYLFIQWAYYLYFIITYKNVRYKNCMYQQCQGPLAALIARNVCTSR